MGRFSVWGVNLGKLVGAEIDVTVSSDSSNTISAIDGSDSEPSMPDIVLLLLLLTVTFISVPTSFPRLTHFL